MSLSFEELEKVPLKQGSHYTRGDGMCALEAVAWLAGETHSDAPQCVCPTIRRFIVNWNDSLPTDEDRNRLIRPLLLKMIGTNTTSKDTLKRSYMVADWMARELVPSWLELAKINTTALRALAPIVDTDTAKAAEPALFAAQKAAYAARAAAWDAARAAAWDAAGAAAWDAAGAAARAAAGAAAMAAARAAAWAAAWDAAGAAAMDALNPTVEKLQASAVTLIERMCEVGK